MAFTDFVVKYDPNKDSPRDLTKRILYSIIIGFIFLLSCYSYFYSLELKILY